MSETFSYETLIRESHLDAFGHVNNAAYLKLFEEARWEIISPRGYGMKEVQATGQGPVVLEVNVKFRKELTLRERIRIETRITEMKGKTWRMEQVMKKQNGEVSALAEFTMGFFDLKARKLIACSHAWLKAIGESGV